MTPAKIIKALRDLAPETSDPDALHMAADVIEARYREPSHAGLLETLATEYPGAVWSATPDGCVGVSRRHQARLIVTRLANREPTLEAQLFFQRRLVAHASPSNVLEIDGRIRRKLKHKRAALGAGIEAAGVAGVKVPGMFEAQDFYLDATAALAAMGDPLPERVE